MKKRQEEPIEIEAEVTSSYPVSMRRDVRGGVGRERKSARRKATSARRKASKLGGIHQRANKRSSW